MKASGMDWQTRERLRFYYNIYTPVECWPPELTSYPGHFLHVAKGDPSKVAFTTSHKHGEADRQTSMRPGRYLRTYYSGLSEGDVNQLSQLFAKKKGKRASFSALKWAVNPKEIAAVYRFGPSSCMAGRGRVAACYGAGDFAVAYLENRVGLVVARAVCVPRLKVFVRVYGSPDLEVRLRELGFRRQTYFEASQPLRLIDNAYTSKIYFDCSFNRHRVGWGSETKARIKDLRRHLKSLTVAPISQSLGGDARGLGDSDTGEGQLKTIAPQELGNGWWKIFAGAGRRVWPDFSSKGDRIVRRYYHFV